MLSPDFAGLLPPEQQPAGPLPADPLGLLDQLGSWDGWSESTAPLGTLPAAAAGAAATAAAAADPLEKRRAQNRAAMQRYRQRQRERQAEQQQQCDELASQLEQARLEHQAVLTQQAELQARHSLRDDWMAALQVLAQAQRAEQAQLAALTTAACSSDGAEASRAAQQLAAWLETAARGSGHTAASGQYVPTLAEAMASALRSSPGVLTALREITPAKLTELYDTVVARLAELLTAVETKGCKAAERQVTDLMVEGCLFFDLLALLRPDYLKLLISERGMEVCEDNQAMLRQAVASLRLSPGQRRGFVAEWRAFQVRQAELASAANAAVADVTAAATAPAGPCAADGQALAAAAAAPVAAAAAEAEAEAAPVTSFAAHAERCMRLAERAGQLAATADAQSAALLAFSDATWYMLSPLQGARLMVACRHFYPDPIQLALAVEAAEAEAADSAESEGSSSRLPPALLEVAAEGDGSECEAVAAECDAAATVQSWKQQAAKQGCATSPGELQASLLNLSTSS